MSDKPQITAPVEMKVGGGYFVTVRWPDGHEEQVTSFSSHEQAELWMKNESADWIGKRLRSK